MNARDASETAEFKRFDVRCDEWRVDEAVRVEIREARCGDKDDFGAAWDGMQSFCQDAAAKFNQPPD